MKKLLNVKFKHGLVLIDYANIKSAVRQSGKEIDLKKLIEYLKSIPGVERVSLYYGTDQRDPRSFRFMQWLRKVGYDVVTKDVKYIKLSTTGIIFNKKNDQLFKHVERKLIRELKQNLRLLSSKGIIFEQRKCNFDVEIALDIYSTLKNYDCYILFSGDSDFAIVLKLIRSKGKKAVIVSSKRFIAGELIKNCDCFVDLKKLMVTESLFLKNKTLRSRVLKNCSQV